MPIIHRCTWRDGHLINRMIFYLTFFNWRLYWRHIYIWRATSMRHLRLVLDNTLGMENQVNSMCKLYYYQIRKIGLILKYINDETWKTLVQALIIYRLANNNAWLYNTRLSLSLPLSLSLSLSLSPPPPLLPLPPPLPPPPSL